MIVLCIYNNHDTLAEETSNEIEYKGYTLRVTWRTIKKPKDDEESVIEGSMFRGRFVTRTLEIS